MALTVRIHKYCKYVFIEFIVCFFSLYSLVGRHYLYFCFFLFIVAKTMAIFIFTFRDSCMLRLYPHVAKLADAEYPVIHPFE